MTNYKNLENALNGALDTIAEKDNFHFRDKTRVIKINGARFELSKTKHGESITNLETHQCVSERNATERSDFIRLRRFFDKKYHE